MSIYSILDIPESKRDTWYPLVRHEPIQNSEILIFDNQSHDSVHHYCRQ
jgi:hypothetical protein